MGGTFYCFDLSDYELKGDLRSVLATKFVVSVDVLPAYQGDDDVCLNDEETSLSCEVSAKFHRRLAGVSVVTLVN